MESKQRVGIIFGGKSGEHEVSLLSAASVIRAMNRQKYELVYIGITREGVWKRYLAPVDSAEAEELAESVELIAAAIEEDRWEEAAEEFCFSQMKDLVDFALPIARMANSRGFWKC